MIKQYLRYISLQQFALITLICLGTGIGSYYWILQKNETVYQSNYQKIKETLVEKVKLQIVGKTEKSLQRLAEQTIIQHVASGKNTPDNQLVLNTLIVSQQILDASLVFVMNSEGLVVASSPYGEGKTITGNNYAFRPYFQQASRGMPSFYFALGVTTLERGLYFALPVFSSQSPKNEIIGTINIKYSLEEIDRLLKNFPHPIALVLEENVIFSTNQPEWLFHSVFPLPETTLQQLKQSKQFADEDIIPLPFHWDQAQTIFQEKAYLIKKIPLEYQSWQLLLLLPPLVFPWIDLFLVIIGLTVIYFLGIAFMIVWGRKKDLAQQLIQTEYLEQVLDERTQELRENEQRYRRLVENSPNTIIIHCNSEIVFSNRAGLALLGASQPNLLLGKSIAEIVHPDYRAISKQRIQQVMGGQEISVLELKFVRLDGTVVDVEAAAIPFEYQGKAAVASIAKDITERKAAEEKIKRLNEKLERRVKERTLQLEESVEILQKTQNQLIVQEKLASLGRMVAGISHELKNPLHLVNNFAEQCMIAARDLQQELKKGSPHWNQEKMDESLYVIEKSAAMANKHGQRADSIIAGMLLHSRGASGEWQLVDVNLLLQEYADLAFHSMRATDRTFNVTFKTNFDDSIGLVKAVPQDISRAFFNILNNSLYAARQRFHEQPTDFVPMVKVNTRQLDNQIEIRIWDNGTGIPQQKIDKIFEPFFTTKPAGEGTGLGLSLCYEIITQEHHGSIRVKSQEGEFTELIVLLPDQKTKE